MFGKEETGHCAVFLYLSFLIGKIGVTECLLPEIAAGVNAEPRNRKRKYWWMH